MTAAPEPLRLFEGRPDSEPESHFEMDHRAADGALEAVVDNARRLKEASYLFGSCFIGSVDPV
jgi:hypothetical protein